MKIGDRIKQRRNEIGLSVDELASRIGKNRATVYRYESNEIEKYPLEILEPLANALCTTPAFLMGWDENYSTEEQLDQKINGVKKWADDFRFTEKQRARIIDYLAESESKQKTLIEKMAESGRSDGKMLMNRDVQRALDDISSWTANAFRYINKDFSDDPFDETNIREQYLSAISKLSRRDKVAWLIRIQDYIDEIENGEHI